MGGAGRQDSVLKCGQGSSSHHTGRLYKSSKERFEENFAWRCPSLIYPMAHRAWTSKLISSEGEKA
jgi:hypothetical protein